MKYTDLMLDIETLGTRPDAAIVQAAARVFNLDGTKGPHINLMIEPSEQASFSMSTISWWCTHEDVAAARPVVFDPRAARMTERTACVVLEEFIDEYADHKYVRIWGNGANFDPVILESMFHRNNMTPSWKFWNIRCLRTLRASFPEVPRSEPTIAHDALSDVDAQIDSVVVIHKLQSRKDAWIPVEERLPEEGVWVLVSTHEVNSLGYFRYAQTAYLLKDKWHQVNGSVSHWQPLPAPPASTSAKES